MVELDDDMLMLIEQGKSIDLIRMWRSKYSRNYSVDDIEGRTVMESAIYRALLGILDPSDIEQQYASFDVVLKKEGVLYYGLDQEVVARALKGQF